MKLFLVIPSLEKGGAERVMSELANQFSKMNHNVHLILLTERKIEYPINDNIRIHKLGFENKGLFKKIFSEIKTFYKLRLLFKNQKPDYVLSFMEKFNIFTLVASYNLNLKVFVSDRSNPYKKISFFLNLLKSITYKYATGIIAQTDLSKQVLLKKINNNNIRVIPNPVKNIAHFPNIIRENIIINVGRLVPEKGHKYLLKAFSETIFPLWKLVILGDGPLRKELTNQAEHLGIQDRLFMPGSVNNIDDWLARSSIFAFTSVSEGFPNALVEAMSSGLPCVSFDCDAGPKDIIIENKNGFLVETKNISSFTNILDKLCADSQLREQIGKEAKEIKNKLDVSIIAVDFLKFFNTTIK